MFFIFYLTKERVVFEEASHTHGSDRKLIQKEEKSKGSNCIVYCTIIYYYYIKVDIDQKNIYI